MSKPIVIVGASAFAEVACNYFESYTDSVVEAFAVEDDYINSSHFMGRPLISLENIQTLYKPNEYSFFTAIVYTKMNTVRTRLFSIMKSKGYEPTSFVSQNAFVSPEAVVSEHCFVMEMNTIQPFTRIGENTILWSGNHIGHHSNIGKNCFISSQVVVSGMSTIEDNCFIGVNACIADNISIGHSSWIGPGSVITTDIKPYSIVRSPKPILSKISSEKFFSL